MRFEEAAELKILYGTEEVQVFTDGSQLPLFDGETRVGFVCRFGIMDGDEVFWEVYDVVQRLASEICK